MQQGLILFPFRSRRLDTEREKDEALLHGLSKQPGSGIIYCSTRKLVEQLTALFQERFPDRTVRAYHAGMDAPSRKKSQEDFRACLLYTSDAAEEEDRVDFGG